MLLDRGEAVSVSVTMSLALSIFDPPRAMVLSIANVTTDVFVPSVSSHSQTFPRALGGGWGKDGAAPRRRNAGGVSWSALLTAPERFQLGSRECRPVVPVRYLATRFFRVGG